MLVLAQAAAHIPPHYFMGFELSEWVQITILIAFVAGIITWIVKASIVTPLTSAINNLSKKVDGIGGNADRVHADHDKRLDKQDIHLARHDEEIKTLFNRTDERGSR